MAETDSFEGRVHRALEDSIVKMVRDGNWITADYASRVKIDAATLRGFYAAVDMERVKARVVERVEDHIADKILNSLATETATDIKQILSNKELREDVRAVLRSKIRDMVAATTEQETPDA